MIETMNNSATLAKLFAALAAAQGELETAAKDKTNTFFRSKYADLASCWDACRGPLAKHELSIIQIPSAIDEKLAEPIVIPGEDGKKSKTINFVQRVTITTVLGHSSGEFISSTLTGLAKGETCQDVLAAITYLRRGALCAMVGIAPEDDDGHSIAGHGAEPAKNPVELDTAEAEAEELKISKFIDKCSDVAKLTKLRADIPSYRLFEQQKTGLIQKIDDKLPSLSTGPDHEQSAMARGEHTAAVNNCNDPAKLLGSVREAIANDKRLTDADRIACTTLLTKRGGVLDGGNGKKRTPAQLMTDFKGKVPLAGRDLKKLLSYREWLNSDEPSGAAAQGLSAEQILELSNVLEPAIEKAEAYQADPIEA